MAQDKDPDAAVEAEFVEVDPSGRYGRYKEVLGKGAFKKVYRAFDEVEGIEVAWNQIKAADLLKNSVAIERLYSEVHLLKTLKHKNILKFYNSWVDAKTENINFITEIFTSGTLRQYRNKHKHVDLRALKKWSRQILEGLSYLHSYDPPIIHRDLKCDNIFVNGNQGEVKIGDLGLAAILLKARSAHSVIGTPEFMAPELYEEEYNELVDIYAFGMCVLELVTFEYPYMECANAAQIYKKVTSGIGPASLVKVKDPEVRAFIEKCIARVSDRLPAKELLMDPFLHSDGYNESVGRSTRTNLYTADEISDNLHNGKKPVETGVESSQDFTVQGQRKDLNTIFLKLRILDSTGQIRNIHFPFDIEVDTSNAVASEMVEELDLTDQDESAIAEMIDTEIQSYTPDWAAKLSADVGNDVPMSDNRITEVQVDSSTLTNESSQKSNFVMERLPSGRKYWSFSPKVSEGSSPVRPGPLILSIENMETPIDGRTEEYEQSPSCRNGPNDETLVEKQVTMSDNNLVDKKDNASNCSQFGTRDLQLGNGPNPDVVNKQIRYDFDIVDDSILVRKLKHVFVEHQRELDELKKKYELVVSDLLKEIPLESRNKFVEVCNMEMADHKIENGSPKPESFLQIKLKDFNTAVEGGNQNVGAESLVFGPIFRDKLKKAKMNAKSDISRMGIAVILRDKSVRRQ